MFLHQTSPICLSKCLAFVGKQQEFHKGHPTADYSSVFYSGHKNLVQFSQSSDKVPGFIGNQLCVLIFFYNNFQNIVPHVNSLPTLKLLFYTETVKTLMLLALQISYQNQASSSSFYIWFYLFNDAYVLKCMWQPFLDIKMSYIPFPDKPF